MLSTPEVPPVATSTMPTDSPRAARDLGEPAATSPQNAYAEPDPSGALTGASTRHRDRSRRRRTAARAGTPGLPDAVGMPSTVGLPGTDGLPGTVGLPGTGGIPGTASLPGAEGTPGTAGNSGSADTSGTTRTSVVRSSGWAAEEREHAGALGPWLVRHEVGIAAERIAAGAARLLGVVPLTEREALSDTVVDALSKAAREHLSRAAASELNGSPRTVLEQACMAALDRQAHLSIEEARRRNALDVPNDGTGDRARAHDDRSPPSDPARGGARAVAERTGSTSPAPETATPDGALRVPEGVLRVPDDVLRVLVTELTSPADSSPVSLAEVAPSALSALQMRTAAALAAELHGEGEVVIAGATGLDSPDEPRDEHQRFSHVLVLLHEGSTTETLTRNSALSASSRRTHVGTTAVSWLLLSAPTGDVLGGGQAAPARSLVQDLTTGRTSAREVRAEDTSGLPLDHQHGLELALRWFVVTTGLALLALALAALLAVLLG